MKFKVSATIPTGSYANICPEIEIEANTFEDAKNEAMKKLLSIWNEYGEKPFPKIGQFIELDTFTGEKIRFNKDTHEYLDLEGNKLLSGSRYAESKTKPFDKAIFLPKVAKKTGVAEEAIDAMWAGNGEISRTFGTALHLAMEQFFTHKDHGTEKEYHLPKHPFLRCAVETFPVPDVLPELLISSVAHKMVGQIDGLVVTGENEGYIIDFKSDGDVQKNLDKHGLQLNFYRVILEKKGWKITKLVVWNYLEQWEPYEIEIKNLK